MSTATEEDFSAFLTRLSAAVGMEPLSPDEDGLVSLSVDGSGILNFYLDTITGSICLFTEIAQLPANPPTLIYRDLMAGCLFGSETDGGWFALEEQNNAVIYTRPFGALPDEDEAFVQLIENTVSLIDAWRSRIQKLLADTPAEADDEPPLPNDGPLFTLQP